MLQRIQTLFLILALACMLMFFVFPFGNIVTQTGETISIGIFGTDYENETGISEYFSVAPLLILISLITLITLITIFLYKKRMLQIRLSFFNIVLQVCSIVLILYFLVQASKKFGEDYSVNVLVILPFVAAILTFLAVRAIGRDEALVRSLNRIR